MFINISAYVDDIVLTAPSWQARNDLIAVLECCCIELDVVCNTSKNVCKTFKPTCRDKVVACNFLCFALCGQKLKYVTQFRHLGHIINDNNTDDDDIKREIRNLFLRTNMLIQRFGNCSVRVIVTYCPCFYDIAL